MSIVGKIRGRRRFNKKITDLALIGSKNIKNPKLKTYVERATKTTDRNIGASKDAPKNRLKKLTKNIKFQIKHAERNYHSRDRMEKMLATGMTQGKTPRKLTKEEMNQIRRKLKANFVD
jgi:hypothetical protein